VDETGQWTRYQYDELGRETNRVTQFLNSHGINAVNMSGGMRAWEKAGLPVVTDAGDPGLII
jgi:rhodanese-related sulfurtransferase